MDDLLDLFGGVSNGFQLRLQRLEALQTLELAAFPARLLALAGRHPGCSQQDLAAWTGRDKAQVARALHDLQARGLIGRSAQPTDRRARRVSLSAEGQAAFATLQRERAQAGAELLATLTQDERDTLRRALVKMRAHLTGADA